MRATKLTFFRLAFILACLFPTYASATYIAFRISDNYIVVGTDSLSLGREASDRFCKIVVLDDTHFFTLTGSNALYDNNGATVLDAAALARRAFGRDPTASVEDLRDGWMLEIATALKSVMVNHPETIRIGSMTGPDFNPFFFKAMFGEIRNGDSRLAPGVVWLDRDSREVQSQKAPDVGRVDDFISENPEHTQLGKQFYAETGAHAADTSNADANTMRGLVEFVIEHTHLQDGGTSLVAVLEYGKPARWFAGGDICQGQ